MNEIVSRFILKLIEIIDSFDQDIEDSEYQITINECRRQISIGSEYVPEKIVENFGEFVSINYVDLVKNLKFEIIDRESELIEKVILIFNENREKLDMDKYIKFIEEIHSIYIEYLKQN
jgi:hypothetical protein